MNLKSYIDGHWINGSGDEVRDINPTRPAEVLATFRLADEEQVHRAAAAAAGAFQSWRALPFHARSAMLVAAAKLLDERADQYGRELTLEEGKTLAEGIGEVRRAGELFRHFAAEANQQAGEMYASPRPNEEILVAREPVGPTALITPWNFPIAIPAWKLAPALAYGNTVVWKPSELVPLLATRLVEVLEESGFPPGVCNLVLTDGVTGGALLDDPNLAACSFTGSTAVGNAVLLRGTRNGKKMQAEMGGKNTAIVMGDAEVGRAAAAIVAGAMTSAGQKCTATGRVLAADDVFDALVREVTELTAALIMGDPLDPSTQIGPVVSAEQQQHVMSQLQQAEASGSRCAIGGEAVEREGGGFFVAPTVLADVTPEHPVFTREVFGPVVAMVRMESGADLFATANRGPYGLSGSIFTADLQCAMAAMRDFHVGVLHVNSETTGADPHVPFGGMKASGSGGREMGKAARDFYTEQKTVYLRP